MRSSRPRAFSAPPGESNFHTVKVAMPSSSALSVDTGDGSSVPARDSGRKPPVVTAAVCERFPRRASPAENEQPRRAGPQPEGGSPARGEAAKACGADAGRHGEPLDLCARLRLARGARGRGWARSSLRRGRAGLAGPDRHGARRTLRRPAVRHRGRAARGGVVRGGRHGRAGALVRVGDALAPDRPALPSITSPDPSGAGTARGRHVGGGRGHPGRAGSPDGFRCTPGWRIASGALWLLAGGFALEYPGARLVAIATLLGVVLILQGALLIAGGLTVRRSGNAPDVPHGPVRLTEIPPVRPRAPL